MGLGQTGRPTSPTNASFFHLRMLRALAIVAPEADGIGAMALYKLALLTVVFSTRIVGRAEGGTN